MKRQTFTDQNLCTCNTAEIKAETMRDSDIQVSMKQQGLSQSQRARANKMIRDQHDHSLQILDDGSAVALNAEV